VDSEEEAEKEWKLWGKSARFVRQVGNFFLTGYRAWS